MNNWFKALFCTTALIFSVNLLAMESLYDESVKITDVGGKVVFDSAEKLEQHLTLEKQNKLKFHYKDISVETIPLHEVNFHTGELFSDLELLLSNLAPGDEVLVRIKKNAAEQIAVRMEDNQDAQELINSFTGFAYRTLTIPVHGRINFDYEREQFKGNLENLEEGKIWSGYIFKDVILRVVMNEKGERRFEERTFLLRDLFTGKPKFREYSVQSLAKQHKRSYLYYTSFKFKGHRSVSANIYAVERIITNQ